MYTHICIYIYPSLSLSLFGSRLCLKHGLSRRCPTDRSQPRYTILSLGVTESDLDSVARQKDRHRQICRQVDRQTDRETNRQTDRQTEGGCGGGKKTNRRMMSRLVWTLLAWFGLCGAMPNGLEIDRPGGNDSPPPPPPPPLGTGLEIRDHPLWAQHLYCALCWKVVDDLHMISREHLKKKANFEARPWCLKCWSFICRCPPKPKTRPAAQPAGQHTMIHTEPAVHAVHMQPPWTMPGQMQPPMTMPGQMQPLPYHQPEVHMQPPMTMPMQMPVPPGLLAAQHTTIHTVPHVQPPPDQTQPLMIPLPPRPMMVEAGCQTTGVVHYMISSPRAEVSPCAGGSGSSGRASRASRLSSSLHRSLGSSWAEAPSSGSGSSRPLSLGSGYVVM